MTAALVGAGVGRDTEVVLADELRLGLRGQVRRVLAPRGVAVVQRLQLTYRWAYLLLAVDPRAGHAPLALAGALPRRADQARPSPRGPRTRSSGTATAPTPPACSPTCRPRASASPPYSPELNPAERVFEELRRRTEGRTYPTVADKQAVVDAYLSDLAADPARVRRLCGWDWLVAALDAVPAA